MFAVLSRSYYPKQTQGLFAAFDGDRIVLQLAMLELPYLENKRDISAIIAGEYWCVWEDHPRFGEVYRLQDVPGRSGILIHPGNYASYKIIFDKAAATPKIGKVDTLGCLLPGMRLEDMNGDGNLDAYQSRKALDIMIATMGKRFKLLIK